MTFFRIVFWVLFVANMISALVNAVLVQLPSTDDPLTRLVNIDMNLLAIMICLFVYFKVGEAK